MTALYVTIVFAVAFLFALVVISWKLRDVTERVVNVEDDLAVDRARDIEAIRLAGMMAQRETDLWVLCGHEGFFEREIVAEWSRPDTAERLPEPTRVSRGIVWW